MTSPGRSARCSSSRLAVSNDASPNTTAGWYARRATGARSRSMPALSSGTTVASRRQHRAQRVGDGGEQLDGIARDVLRDDLAVPVEDRAARRRQRHRAQPVGLGPQLVLLVLDDLRAEEGAREHQEGDRDDPARAARPPLQLGGIEVVHCCRAGCGTTRRTAPAAPCRPAPWSGPGAARRSAATWRAPGRPSRSPRARSGRAARRPPKRKPALTSTLSAKKTARL